MIFADMDENDISYAIRDAAFRVHNEFGPGLLESVYEKALQFDLIKNGFEVQIQVGIPVAVNNETIGIGYRMDLLVNDLVVVEVKSVESLQDVHYKQLLTYLKISDKKLGLLINFNSSSLDKKSMVRIVNNL